MTEQTKDPIQLAIDALNRILNLGEFNLMKYAPNDSWKSGFQKDGETIKQVFEQLRALQSQPAAAHGVEGLDDAISVVAKLLADNCDCQDCSCSVCKVLDAARSAARLYAQSRQAVPDGWKTIESAPKDGTKFIAWDGMYSFTCRAGKQYVKFPHEDGGPTYKDVWHGVYKYSIYPEKPTHWMPLPAAQKHDLSKGE